MAAPGTSKICPDEAEASWVVSLRAAMSAQRMHEALRQEWDYAGRHGLQVQGCELVRVFPRRGNEFLLEYNIHVSSDNGEEHLPVFGELVGESASDRCRATIASLKKRRRGQLPLRDPQNLVSCLPTLGLVLRFPGLDERLAGLRAVYDHEFAEQFLRTATKAPIGSITTELLGHRLGKRCVIRFRYDSGDPNLHHSLIAKMYKTRSRRAREVYQAMSWLRDLGMRGDAPSRIVAPIVYLSRWNSVLMEDVEAQPLFEVPQGDFPNALNQTGQALSRLHRSAIGVSARYTVDDEIELLQRWARLVIATEPALAGEMDAALHRVISGLARCRVYTAVPVHRDFYEKQVLVRNGQVILLDLDTLCRADPALDIGNFLAHLELATHKGITLPARSPEAFCDGYGSRLDSELLRRVRVYTNSARLRLACLYFFWPRWRHVTNQLLEAIHAD